MVRRPDTTRSPCITPSSTRQGWKSISLSFFFQAEDGIRDSSVTGFRRVLFRSFALLYGIADVLGVGGEHVLPAQLEGGRSEERRVGKECRSRWSPYH